MKQLFVVHTQYNLILATGMANKQDDLILFQDFDLKDDLKSRLINHFESCLFLPGCYPHRRRSIKDKEIEIQHACKEIKNFIKTSYDEIYIVDDSSVPEMCALKYTYKNNYSVIMAALEDGGNAYFSNGIAPGGMDSSNITRLVRKIYFSFHYALFGFYDSSLCMGAHKRLSKIYLTFPGHARAELRNKEQIPITQEQFKCGLKIMYTGKPVALEDECVVFAVDKLDVYGDKLPIVNKEIEKLVMQARIDGKKVYCKYHPRETQKMDALLDAEELNSKIAMEYYLTNTTAQNMTVVGVMSTALQTAKKLGFDVVSLAASVGTNEDVITFYRSIGIEVI